MVNLCVSGEEVVFQPGKYDQAVIDAIKELLPNRRYHAPDRSWRAPVESLPAAVALFAHMGRAADAGVQARAAAVAAAGADQPRIGLALRLALTPAALAASAEGISLGKVGGSACARPISTRSASERACNTNSSVARFCRPRWLLCESPPAVLRGAVGSDMPPQVAVTFDYDQDVIEAITRDKPDRHFRKKKRLNMIGNLV
jgi:hypothetical protein